MTLEDRLIMEKDELESKRELARQIKQTLETDHPFHPNIGESSQRIGSKKNSTMKLQAGIPVDTGKWEQLYRESEKQKNRKDLP